MQRTLKIGTRGSTLALRQAEMARSLLESHWPGLRVELRTVRTQGDDLADVPLTRLPERGAFVKALERTLEAREVDAAAHSLKDVPGELPPGLVLAAFLEREDPRDVLVSRTGLPLAELPAEATVGTGSPRRAVQLRQVRPDLIFVEFRGNLDTRLAKIARGTVAAGVLAAAGLKRLGLESQISEYLPPGICLPAVGQGIIAVECREDDHWVRDLLAPLDNVSSRRAAAAERSFMRAVGGGCRLPVAALAIVSGQVMTVDVMLAESPTGHPVRGWIEGSSEKPEELGKALAATILQSVAAPSMGVAP